MTRLLACTFLASVLVAAAPARAAEDTAVCTGFISTLPAVISTQGTWCMTQDLSTPIAAGAAIEIATNNVVIDCNHFKVGGLAAGAGTQAVGVIAVFKKNITIRRCNFRGFEVATYLLADGVVVEHNRMEGNTARGTYVSGNGNLIRGNFVLDTGGNTSAGERFAIGISAYGDVDVLDNTITGAVATAGGGGRGLGIIVGNDSEEPGQINISNNRIRGVVSDGATSMAAISSYSEAGITVRDNVVFGSPGDNDFGILCVNSSDSGDVSGNSLLGLAIPISNCGDDGGNVIKP